MEDLLNTIENLIKQREDYARHLRFGTQIAFLNTNNEIHRIGIDSYTIDEYNEYNDVEGSFFDSSSKRIS